MTDFRLRPRMLPDDQDFLLRLYASTRADELALVDWSEDQKDAFVRAQFEAQTAHYDKYYTGASFDVVELDNIPVGRLYVLEMASEIRIVDISLLPEFRDRGIGTQLLETLIRRATEQSKTLSIHVEIFNPALRLYERLGFRQVNQYGAYYLMEFRPGNA